jgi:hypothetical protein
VSERHVVKPSAYSITGTAGNPSRKQTVADLIRERYCECGRERSACVGGYAKNRNTIHADKDGAL